MGLPTVYPGFAQSKERVNGGTFTVELKKKVNIGVSIGVATACLFKEAQSMSTFAAESYMFDCRSGVLRQNFKEMRIGTWPSKVKEGDKLGFEMNGDKLNILYNDLTITQIVSPSFAGQEFFMTVMMWP